MSSEPLEYLRHIMVEANYLISASTGLKLEEFVADETLRRAVVAVSKSLERPRRKFPQSFAKVPGCRVAGDGWDARPFDSRLLRSGL